MSDRTPVRVSPFAREHLRDPYTPLAELRDLPLACRPDELRWRSAGLQRALEGLPVEFTPERPLPPALPRSFGSPDWWVDVRWDDVRPRYEELADRPLDEVDRWLEDWSRLEAELLEGTTLATIAYSADTRDGRMEEAKSRWASEIRPAQQEQVTRLAQRLLESGHCPEGLETAVRRFRSQAKLYQPENEPLRAEISRLEAACSKIRSAMVDWDGERLTLPQVAAKQRDPERDVRERAFRLGLEPFIDRRTELADVFDEMYARRQQIARNAGFANYREYAHREMNRFDYWPDDCLRWDGAVEEAIVPAAERVLERRRRRLGVETLRPWDVQADPLGRAQLRPVDTVADLCERAVRVFEHLDSAFGRFFRTMVDEGLLDLESREGKVPGSFCAPLPHRKRAFVYMNASGGERDVWSLLHESGHAFHAFEGMAAQPLVWPQLVGSEMVISEVAAMAMELLAAPYLAAEDVGLYTEAEYRRTFAEHLESILLFFGHCAAVDAFQHWLYTDPAGADRDARDERWLELRRRVDRGVDWSGLDAYSTARWYAQMHIFYVPFYYIEYGIARLASLEIWRNSLGDPAVAVRRYRDALALGSSRPLPELLAAAGAGLIFDGRRMRELVDEVEKELDRLQEQSGAPVAGAGTNERR